MAICPKCQNKLKEEFGLETCSKCGAVVFIDLDDQVTLQEDSDQDMSLDIQEIVEGDESEYNLEGSFLDSDIAEPNSVDEIETNLDQAESEIEREEDFIIDDLNDELNTEDETLAAPIIEKRNDITGADEFLEAMQLFGDLDVGKFNEAIYFFDIRVVGIDSKDIRSEVIDILSEDRLGLKIESFNKIIKNGILTLTDVPAVKAYVLVQNLSHLPCDLSWTLKEVQDLVADPGDEDSIEA